MYGKFQDFLKTEIQSIKDAGLYKTERLIATPQGAEIKLTTGETVLNFCANNYLGLSSDPRVIEGAKKGLDARGYGMSSVRFICGTQDIHKELEAKISKFFGTEDTISMPLVSTLTAVFSNRYSARKMPSSPTN